MLGNQEDVIVRIYFYQKILVDFAELAANFKYME